MKKRLLALILFLSTQAAIAEEVSVRPEPPKKEQQQKATSFVTRSKLTNSPAFSTTTISRPGSIVVTRDENGHIQLDGKTFAERHPIFENRVAKPVKKVCKPMIWLDHKTGFHKARHMTSDALIVSGAKFKPYEPIAGAAITTNQLINLVAPRR